MMTWTNSESALPQDGKTCISNTSIQTINKNPMTVLTITGFLFIMNLFQNLNPMFVSISVSVSDPDSESESESDSYLDLHYLHLNWYCGIIPYDHKGSTIIS